MSFALRLADVFGRLLVPLLLGAFALLAALLVVVLGQHVVRDVRARMRRRVEDRYRPLVAHALFDEAPTAADALGRPPKRHRPILGELILAMVRTLGGAPVGRARVLAQSLDLTAAWGRDLGDRRWWRRAAAARGLGILGEASAYDALVNRLDDHHEEVRAAAVEALGRLRDPRVVSELLARVLEQSRHQRVRIIEALRVIGPDGGPQLLEQAHRDPQLLPLLTDLLPYVAGASAVNQLLVWSGDPRPEVRAAAMSALGTIGLDDRSFYYALRALNDAAASVRAMAARALGRYGRRDAAPYLAVRLDDEWEVAASSARALAGLADEGVAALERRSTQAGQGSDLARQVLWQMRARRAPAAPRRASVA